MCPLQNEKGAINALSVPTLADLIQARKAARGWSYREIAARGNDVISAQRWQQLGTGVRLKEFPEPTTVAAMADALEVDVAAVLLATAKSLGLDVQRRQSELAAMLPSTAERLTPEQRDAVLAVVRAMTPTQETRNEDQDTQDPQGDPPADGETGTRRAPMKGADIAWLEDHRAPDVDDMLDRVTAEARRQEVTEQDSEEPLPFEPHGVRAARDIDGPTQGELRRRPGKDAGEENQEPNDWEGA